MYDLHQPLAFGGNVDPTAADPTWPLRLARAIDAAGLEFIGIQDHPYNASFLDTWTMQIQAHPFSKHLLAAPQYNVDPHCGQHQPGQHQSAGMHQQISRGDRSHLPHSLPSFPQSPS